MFARVCERAAASGVLQRVVLATDDQRILEAAEQEGVEALMTRPDHASGTDRVCEAARLMGVEPDAVVVNVQGDEPALDPAMLRELVAPFRDPDVRVATLARELNPLQAGNPDRVKVVTAVNGDALYFSRAPLPFDRDGHGGPYLGHIGMYAFRMDALERFTALSPTPLEQKEKLEQLRLLEHGVPIRVVRTERRSHGVDRPEDIALVETIITEQT
jgi:3-deoxy-manno-octulosonate cytidylyltransferase (CMP-KDO synthetase)